MLATAVQQHNAAERDGEEDGVLQLVGIDFDSEDLGGEAVAGASSGGCGCGSVVVLLMARDTAWSAWACLQFRRGGVLLSAEFSVLLPGGVASGITVFK